MKCLQKWSKITRRCAGRYILPMIRIAALFGLNLFITGCVPIPHTVPVTPATKGLLLENGKPLVGTKVSLVADENCAKTIASTISNAEGQFAFEETTKFEWFVVAMGHHLSAWSICLGDPPSTNIYNGRSYSLFGAAYSEELVCDTVSPPIKDSTCVQRHMLESASPKI